MKLLRFLALFFATLTRRHRQPPTARTPSPEKPEKSEKSEEDIYFETLDRLFTEFEEMLAQFKAGTLPAHLLAKPNRARKSRETAEDGEEAENLPRKTGPNWHPVPPRPHQAKIHLRRRPETRPIRRTNSLIPRKQTRAHLVTI